MKRGAEKQLTKDDEPDDENEEVGQGFKKADETALASRKIKGLPKRVLAGSASSTPPPIPTTAGSSTVPKFSGFSGFGSATGNSSPFTFAGTAAPKAPVPTAPTGSPFAFSVSSAGASGASTTSTSTPTPAPLSSRTFGPATETLSSPPAQSPPATAPSSEDERLTAEIEYYKALRGLNNSFVLAVSKAVESDPFTDAAELLERYKNLRISVKTEYDEKLKKLQSVPSAGATWASSASISTKPPAMPAPPASFTAFGSAPPSKSSSFTSTPITTFSSADSEKSGETGSATSSAFSNVAFAPSSLTPSNKSDGTVKSAFSFGASSATPSAQDTSSTTKRSPFEFTAPASSGETSSAKPSPFALGTPSSTTASKSPFAFSPSTTSTSSLSGATKSTFAFGSTSSTPSSSAFGAFSTAPSSFAGGSVFGNASGSFAGKSKEKEEEEPENPADADSTSKDASTVGGSIFGAQPVFGTSDKPALTIFGSTGASKATGFGAPAKGSGSIGNPVGFGFGSPPRTPEAEAIPVGKVSPFAFAPSKPAEADADAKKSPWELDAGPPKLKPADWSRVGSTDEGGSTSAEGTPGPESSAEGSDTARPLVSTSSIHDMEGEGEEHEETTHEIRSKVFKMVKRADKSEWGDMGVGVLRLKKHKETESRRVLLRNSSTGKVTVNFIIYAGMTPAVSKNVVSFIGHDEGASTAYRIRTKTEEQANALKRALDREIEFVKAKSEKE